MLNKLIQKTLNFTKEHSPEILVTTGVVGMVTSTVLAVKATPKALDLMEDKKSELGVTYLTGREIVESTWKEYVPAVGVGVVSAACIIAGTTQNSRRNTALATVYKLSESTLKEYQKKTEEVVGKEKADEIEREVAKARIKERPTFIQNDNSDYIYTTGHGDTLMYDSLSGRYFRSSMNAVDRAVNEINKSLLSDYVMTVNDFYIEIEIPTIGAGSLIGWKSDKEMMEVRYDSDVDSNGQPYLILSYSNRPIALENRHTY